MVSKNVNKIVNLHIFRNGKYEKEFDEKDLIGCGNFGIVYKSIDKIDKKVYAIKKIALNDQEIESVSKELKIISELKSDFVVEFINAWVEKNYIKPVKKGFLNKSNFSVEDISYSHRVFDQKRPQLLHIQMEFCFKTLKDLINAELKQKSMNSVVYYISSELFIELLECVQYLHKQNIIHRNLKPANILVSYGSHDRFLKLGDYGISAFHEFDDQSHTQMSGTLKYIAPEVLKGSSKRKYGTKADIYSLGIITQELYDFKNCIIPKENSYLQMKFSKLKELNSKMISDEELRPNCDEILIGKEKWILSLNDIKNDIFELIRSLSNDSFKYLFLEKKIQIENNKFSSASTSSSRIEVLDLLIPKKQIEKEKKEEKIIDFECGKYEIEFHNECLIGSGNYGIVYKSIDKINEKFYAIKLIPLNNGEINSVLNELINIYKLKSDYVVEFINAWVENNYLKPGEKVSNVKNINVEKISYSHRVFDPNCSHLLHIQMEFCYKTLQELINTELNQKLMNPLDYYISSELFIELLECVQYLHNHKIIHRDLKPANIFLSDALNDRFLKIGDFGNSILHEFDNQSHTHRSGTFKYMAPEVLKGRKYDTKADIYSLGIIAQELYDFKNCIIPKENSYLQMKFSNLKELNSRMISDKELRQNCNEILIGKEKWILSLNDIKNIFELIRSLSKDSFKYLFLEKKVKAQIEKNKFN